MLMSCRDTDLQFGLNALRANNKKCLGTLLFAFQNVKNFSNRIKIRLFNVKVRTIYTNGVMVITYLSILLLLKNPSPCIAVLLLFNKYNREACIKRW